MIFSSPTLATGTHLGIDKQGTTVDTFIFLGRDFTKAASTKKNDLHLSAQRVIPPMRLRLELQLEKSICTDWDYQTILFN